MATPQQVRGVAAAASRTAATVRPPAPVASQAPRPTRGRWFLLGLVAGAVVTVVARGEGPATLHDLREWSARTLRSLEHRHERRPQSDAAALPPALAQTPAIARPSSEAPCPMNPGPDDPCAELLAPFQTATAALDVPTFPVESLPRVKHPAVARRHHARPAPAAIAPPSDDDAEDDAQSTTPAPAPKRDELVAPERIPIVAPEQTAENDLR